MNSKKRTLLVRADASASISTGHIMRCRNLARELSHHEVEVIFICRRQPGDLISLLREEFQVLSLPERQGFYSDQDAEGFLKSRNIYATWLGCSQEQDAADTLEALKVSNVGSVDWVTIDHYGIDAKWHQLIRTVLPNVRVMVIDDLADRQYDADILLDQNFFGRNTQKRYEGLVPDTCRLLLGPDFVLLGEEYRLLHPIVPLRNEISRVMIFFGGHHNLDLTSKAIDVMVSPEFRNISIDVVLDAQSESSVLLRERYAGFRKIQFHSRLQSLAILFLRADLGIGAGGISMYERMCLKLPTIAVATAANQNNPLLFASERGLRAISINNFQTELKLQVLNMHEKNGAHLLNHFLDVDGLGKNRVASALLQL
jgi:UDP-2,4-diacetamido-2,4,6-trideoxy-beta-L-altropyranose hydrolase